MCIRDSLEGAGVRVALLTGSTVAAERAAIVEHFAAGKVDVLIGTHALLSDDVVPRNLTLAVSYTHLDVYKRQALARVGVPAEAVTLVDQSENWWTPEAVRV